MKKSRIRISSHPFFPSIFRHLPSPPHPIPGLQEHPAPVVSAEDPNASGHETHQQLEGEEHRETRGNPGNKSLDVWILGKRLTLEFFVVVKFIYLKSKMLMIFWSGAYCFSQLGIWPLAGNEPLEVSVSLSRMHHGLRHLLLAQPNHEFHCWDEISGKSWEEQKTRSSSPLKQPSLKRF